MKFMTLGLAGILATGATQQIRADAGTGAVIGAVAGGIIGHQSRETAAGVVVGAVAGGLIGGALDRDRDDRASSRTVVEYRDHGRYDSRCDDPRWSPRYSRYPHHPVVYIPAPRPRPIVVVVQSPPPCPEPVVVVRPAPAATATCLADDHGYTSTQYLALMNPLELDLLRQRAYGQSQADLSLYLTDQEKGLLRARAARQVVIGS